MPWATLSVMFGRDINIMTNSHGDIYMNAPLQACIFIPWQSSYPGGIVMVSLSECIALYHIAYMQCM